MLVAVIIEYTELLFTFQSSTLPYIGEYIFIPFGQSFNISAILISFSIVVIFIVTHFQEFYLLLEVFHSLLEVGYSVSLGIFWRIDGNLEHVRRGEVTDVPLVFLLNFCLIVFLFIVVCF